MFPFLKLPFLLRVCHFSDLPQLEISWLQKPTAQIRTQCHSGMSSHEYSTAKLRQTKKWRPLLGISIDWCTHCYVCNARAKPTFEIVRNTLGIGS